MPLGKQAKILSKGQIDAVLAYIEKTRHPLRNRVICMEASGLDRSEFVIATQRADRTSAQAIVNLFSRWYEQLGFAGASSHSGRRTFITNAARKIPSVGGSIRDVQLLAGHVSLRTTQRYIEADAEAQRKVVQLV